MKFNDLSIQEKAAIIKLGIGGGLRSLQEIQQFWDGMPDDPPVIQKVNKSNADFVQRLKDPNREYIRDWENNNNIATHKLSWAEDDNDAIVYPNVQEVNGKLIDYTRPPYDTWAGYENAIRTGDTIRMTPQEAEWFTTHYKDYYPGFDEYREGGSIHIKPENRGKFNAIKKRTGKTTEELTHSKNPLTRKRAIFAQNMAKIRRKHEYGGFIQGMEYDLDPIDIQQLINFGYEIEYI